MTCFGMLRIKNEARWIDEVVASILPLCERVFVLDDHSTDGTPELLESMERVSVFRSKFKGLDETRDKNFLLGRIMDSVSEIYLRGDDRSPFWVLAIDGDEVLAPGGQVALRSFIEGARGVHAAKLPVRYLWNDRKQVRVDGVYEDFARPSLFRLMNRAFTFQSTPFGGNFHCSSIPQQLLHHAHVMCRGAELLHLGYMHKKDRLRKYEWYNRIDPNNSGEDCYRHMVIGDVFPANSKFLHAGPLELRPIA